MKIRYLLPMVFLLIFAGCKEEAEELSRADYERLVTDSLKNTMTEWLLLAVDGDYYYIKVTQGTAGTEVFKLSRSTVRITGDTQQLPRRVKINDIQWIE